MVSSIKGKAIAIRKGYHGDHTRAIEYEDVNIVLRTEERRRESERERDLSIYSSIGDYLHVGCHLTSPTDYTIKRKQA
jgi:hypothetical protein